MYIGDYKKGKKDNILFYKCPFYKNNKPYIRLKIRIFQMLIIVRKLRCSYEVKEVGINTNIMLKIAYSQEKSAQNSIF